MTLTVGSLFSGLGGIDLAFERHGFAVAWQVEIDRDAQHVLRRHWPDVPLYDDVCAVGAHNLAPVDVITFGSPCQDVSLAGRREGLDGEQSSLFYEAIRIIDELRPALAVFENVPGLLSSHAGRDFAAVLGAFRQCGACDIGWRILDAQHFGVPQRRRRVFVVADFSGDRAGEILFKPESVCGDSATGRTAGSGVATTDSDGIGAGGGRVVSTLTHGGDSHRGYHVNAEMAAGGRIIPILEATSRQGRSSEGSVGVGKPGDPMYTLQAGAQHGVYITGTGDAAPPLTARYYKGVNTTADEVLVCITDAVTHTLTACAETECTDTIASTVFDETQITSWANRSNPRHGDPCHTLSAGARPPSLIGTRGIRRLMPIECERLMGLPDHWTAHDAAGVALSDSARYRMIGNSVAVPVVEWIAQRAAAALTEQIEMPA